MAAHSRRARSYPDTWPAGVFFLDGTQAVACSEMTAARRGWFRDDCLALVRWLIYWSAY